MPQIFAFWQHASRVTVPMRESPDTRQFIAVKHGASRLQSSGVPSSAALHDHARRVKMASSRALPHLFTEPNRYN
jgi:hypothetical protein